MADQEQQDKPTSQADGSQLQSLPFDVDLAPTPGQVAHLGDLVRALEASQKMDFELGPSHTDDDGYGPAPINPLV